MKEKDNSLPVTIRTTTLIKSLDRIENIVSDLLEGDKKEGAIKALNLFRKELNLPSDK